MEWLFGSSKKASKPAVYVSNVVEGDFNVVSTAQPSNRAPYPLYPNLPAQAIAPAQYSTSSFYVPPPSNQNGSYPLSPQHGKQQGQYSQQQGQYSQQQGQYSQQQGSNAPSSKPVNPLESIPFKLSSALDSNALPVNEYQLKSIKSQLDNVCARINSDAFNYSFELERSVLSEMNYR